MNPEIAKTVIEQMGSQIDLLVTLATAVFGGLIALFVQVLIHNSDPSKTPINFNRNSFRLVIAALLLQGGSIVFAYLARGTITAQTPAIFQVDFSALKDWGAAPLPDGGNIILKILPLIQFILFFLGLLMLSIFMIRNSHLMGGKRR